MLYTVVLILVIINIYQSKESVVFLYPSHLVKVDSPPPPSYVVTVTSVTVTVTMDFMLLMITSLSKLY